MLAGPVMTARDSCITPEAAQTLPGLLRERVKRDPDSRAYGFHDDGTRSWKSLTWRQVAYGAASIQSALRKEPLARGDRVGIMLRNCVEWVMFDLAALGLDLVTVPLYTNDRAENVAYIIRNAGIKLILVQNQRQWSQLSQVEGIRVALQRAVCLAPVEGSGSDGVLVSLRDWQGKGAQDSYECLPTKSGELATIVYTSGTTGRPKGVMLSHDNILRNAYAALQCAEFSSHDVFLSFLPLSHALERTAGCFMPMMANSKVTFARSVQQLAQDLLEVCPTVFVSVPRIYEMMYTRILGQIEQRPSLARKVFSWTLQTGWRRTEWKSGRNRWHWSLLLWPLFEYLVAGKITRRLGGKLRYAIAGGAALDRTITQFFISLGVPLYQGYGMTESGPVISVGRPRGNDPFSIGKALPGVEIRLTADSELCTRSKCVMLGYYKNPQATQQVIDEEGWLHTGDIVRVSAEGYLYITGRIKDIIVLANAEKVSPQDMESAICADPLFEQVMLLGEGRPFLCALLVLNETQWNALAASLGLERTHLADKAVRKHALQRVADCLQSFPGYAQVRRVCLYLEPWTVENGLLTPTLKVRKPELARRFAKDIDAMYGSLAE
ncbi:MAG: long-chain fatty acid--CoA ligase [Gammaproteobacteria bacterium]|nr:long-chain fatty acid--CoA ligase [Gammaproteobacteria bacterium]